MSDTLPTPDSNRVDELIAFDARTRRVLELREQVREGTYRPDPREIAEAILKEWLGAPELAPGDAPALPVDSVSDRRTIAARFVVPKSPLEASDSSRERSA